MKPIYLITGDEPLLVEEACDAIRQQAKAEGFSERIRLFEGTGFQWAQLLEHSQSLSLFSEQRLLDLQLTPGKLSKEGAEQLIAYTEQLSPDTCLLIQGPKFDKTAQKAAWWKAIEKAGEIKQLWPIDADNFPSWLKQRANALQLQLDTDAHQQLVFLTEGNLLAAKQALEKLCLLCENNAVTLEHIEQAVSDSAQFDIFKFVDHCLMGETEKLARILTQLKNTNAQPTLILWSLTKELRTVIDLKTGKTPYIWPKRQALFRQATQRLSLDHLYPLLRLAHTIDKTIKGAGDGDVWNLLLDLSLGLAGVHSHVI